MQSDDAAPDKYGVTALPDLSSYGQDPEVCGNEDIDQFDGRGAADADFAAVPMPQLNQSFNVSGASSECIRHDGSMAGSSAGDGGVDGGGRVSPAAAPHTLAQPQPLNGFDGLDITISEPVGGLSDLVLPPALASPAAAGRATAGPDAAHQSGRQQAARPARLPALVGQGRDGNSGAAAPAGKAAAWRHPMHACAPHAQHKCACATAPASWCYIVRQDPS